MLNRVILIGRLASDPEMKYTPSGIPVAEFRIAVDRPMSAEARAQNQEKQTDFISIVAWRQSAEFAANYLHKGRLVAVEGRLQVREYVAQDGQKRRIYEVVADNLKGLDRPNREGGEGGEGGASGYAAEGGARSGGGGGYERPSGGSPAPNRPAGSSYSGGTAGGGGGGYASSGGPAKSGTPARGNGAPQPAGNGGAGGGGGDFDDDYGDLSDPFAE